VVTGGQYDVDVTIEAPNKEIIYKEVKKQYDTFTWVPSVSGVFSFCFSNEFSTFSHKLIYLDLQVGEEAPLPGLGEHATALTQVILIFLMCVKEFVLNVFLLIFSWNLHLNKFTRT
jgi:hypothetical protein